MAVQFCFWQWNNHGLKRIGAAIDLSPNPGTTHSHSSRHGCSILLLEMEQAWLYAFGVPSSAPGQAIQLPNPRPYATHSRAVLTWIFNSHSGKVVGQQIRLGW